MPLYGLLFAMALIFLPVKAQAAWLAPAWSNRSAVTVNNPGGTTLTDFQVHIVLDSSFDFTKAKSDGSDVRVLRAMTALPLFRSGSRSGIPPTRVPASG